MPVSAVGLEEQCEDRLLGAESTTYPAAKRSLKHMFGKLTVIALALSALLAGANIAFQRCSFVTGAHHRINAAESSLISENIVSGAHANQFTAPAVTWSGGGFLALSNYVGLTAALLNVSGKSLDDLFDKVGTWSSNSGGTWFSAEIIYSRSFNDLLRNMAADPATAGLQFNMSWVKPLVTKTEIPITQMPSVLKWAHNCKALYNDTHSVPHTESGTTSQELHGSSFAPQGTQHLPTPLQQDMKILFDSLVTDGALNWEAFVEWVLESTAGIGNTRKWTMGSNVQSWAEGMLWNVGISMPTPGGRFYPNGPAADGTKCWLEHSLDGDTTTYNVSSTAGIVQPMYTPARFSQILNSASTDMPLPFCAEETCFGLSIRYAGLESDTVQIEIVKSLSAVFGEAFSAQVPLSRVAASSSAAGGSQILSLKSAMMMDNPCVQFATFISNAGNGKTYQKASQVLYPDKIAERSFQTIASNAVQVLVDGGFTDNTGLAWAVKAGATEITAIGKGHNDGFFDLFDGSPANACDDNLSVTCQVFFQIFGAPTFHEANEQYEDFSALQPQFESQFLESIKYGRFVATTRDNMWFGIQAGIKVTINAIFINTRELTVGGNRDYYLYGTLVQEIMTTIVSASQAEELVKMFPHD